MGFAVQCLILLFSVRGDAFPKSKVYENVPPCEEMCRDLEVGGSGVTLHCNVFQHPWKKMA